MRFGMPAWREGWWLLVVVACLAACTEDLEPSCTTETGEPYLRPCTCGEYGIGVQVCDANGAWGLCNCPNQGPPPAGTGGTSGMGGTGGTGGTPAMPDAGSTPDTGTPAAPDGGADAATAACALDADCAAPTPACDTTTGACVACTMDVHCAPGTCDTTTKTCAGGCTSNADCAAPTPVCDTTAGVCVECTGDADCSDAATPHCGPVRICVECVMDDQCPALDCPLALNCCGATNECACSAPFATMCPP